MSFDPTGRYKGNAYDPNYHLKKKQKQQGGYKSYNNNDNFNGGGGYKQQHHNTPSKGRWDKDYENRNGYDDLDYEYEGGGGGGRYDSGNKRSYGGGGHSGNGYGNGNGGGFDDRREYSRPDYDRPDPYGRDGGRGGYSGGGGGGGGPRGHDGGSRRQEEDWEAKVARVEADVRQALEEERVEEQRLENLRQMQELPQPSPVSASVYHSTPTHTAGAPPVPLAARFAPLNSNPSTFALPYSSQSPYSSATQLPNIPPTPTPMQATAVVVESPSLAQLQANAANAASTTTTSALPLDPASDKIRLFKEQVERSRVQQLAARLADDPVRTAELYLQKKDASRPPSPAAAAPPPTTDQRDEPEEGEVVPTAPEVDKQSMLKEKLRQTMLAKRGRTANGTGAVSASAEPTKEGAKEPIEVATPAKSVEVVASTPAVSTPAAPTAPPVVKQTSNGVPNGDRQGGETSLNNHNNTPGASGGEPQRNTTTLETPFAIAARKRAEQRSQKDGYPPRSRSISPPRQRRSSPPRTDPTRRLCRNDEYRASTEQPERRLFSTRDPRDVRDKENGLASRVGDFARPHALTRQISSSSDMEMDEPLPPQIQPRGVPWPLPRTRSPDKALDSRLEARRSSDAGNNGQSSALVVHTGTVVKETSVAVVQKQPAPSTTSGSTKGSAAKVLGAPPNHWIIKQLQFLKAQISELEKLIVQDDATAPAGKLVPKESPAKQGGPARTYAGDDRPERNEDVDGRRRYDHDDDDRRPNYNSQYDRTYNKNETGKVPYEKKSYHNSKPYDRPYQKQHDQDRPYSKPTYDPEYKSKPTYKAYHEYSNDRPYTKKQGDDDWHSQRGEGSSRGGRGGRGGYRGNSSRGGYQGGDSGRGGYQGSDSGRGGYSNYKRDGYGGGGSKDSTEGYQRDNGGYQRKSYNNDRGDDYSGGRGGYSRGGHQSSRGGRGDYNGGGRGGYHKSNYYDENPRY